MSNASDSDGGWEWNIIAKEYDYCLLVVKGGRAGSVSVTEKGHFCRHRE